MSSADDLDQQMRLAAFRHLVGLNHGGAPVHWSELTYGFEHANERFQLVGVAGIWKPRAMPHLLSVRTGLGRDAEGYEDYESGIEEVLNGADHVRYAFRRGNVNHAHNRYLYDAMTHDVPLFYFLAAGNGRYLWAAPAYIALVDKISETCEIVFGSPDRGPAYELPGLAERVHGMRLFRERIERHLPRAQPPLRLERPLRMVAEDPPQ